MIGTSCSNNSQGEAMALIPRQSPRIVEQFQRGDVHVAEASRKRKGKSVAPNQLQDELTAEASRKRKASQLQLT
ncbi:hypothetical protein MKW98_030401, partial [Papaver atlanticum]